jgi:hydrogenase maturation protease
LIVCVGNGLVADDAAGAAVYAALVEAPPPLARVALLATGGIRLLDLVEGEESLIVVDAVQLGAKVGTVHVLDWESLPRAQGPAVSVHGIGVREAIEMGRMLIPERMPRVVSLVGIEGKCFDELGGPMTAEVREAIPRAVTAVNTLAFASRRGAATNGSEGAEPLFAPPRGGAERYVQEISRLVDAMTQGKLDVRADASSFSPSWAAQLGLVNRMLDTLIAPLRLATGALDQIARGSIPNFVIDEYQGEFDDIKRSLNAFLAVMFGMHREMQSVVEAIKEGSLRSRGNDWDFSGNWQMLIAGVNETLDAVIYPVQAASAVLARMAKYDLTSRMTGHYKGEHAEIKRAVNATIDALVGALREVGDAAQRVSLASTEILESNHVVAEGASEQAKAIAVTSYNLESLAQSCRKNLSDARQACVSMETAKRAVHTSKEAATELRADMGKIRSSSEGTVAILQEINELAQQTDGLATDASTQGEKVTASGRGFAVVALEVRKLSGRCADAASSIDKAVSGGTAGREAKIQEIVSELRVVARESNYLALNAAIEAAHIADAGMEFRRITDRVRQLSLRSKEAAQKTEGFVSAAVEHARGGLEAALRIDQKLAEVVAGVGRGTELMELIAAANEDQTESVTAMASAMTEMSAVTTENASSAESSSKAAEGLASLTRRLEALVARFKLA